ncbi:hypothetical protein JCM11251_003653 [Rhodosporidiobolus azoricus]
MPNNHSIDLSDFDPFSSSSSRSISPHPQGSLFPTSSHSSTSSTTPNGTAASVPAAKQDVHSQSVRGGGDPLLGATGDLLGGLSLSSPSQDPYASRATPPSEARGASGRSGLNGEAVQAQEQRQSHILADLNREPFTAEPSSSSFSAFPPSSSRPIPHASHPPHPPFSPPRRLSTLMSPSSPTSSRFAPSSPPAESSALSDPFHPDLEVWLRGGEEGNVKGMGRAERRMREASGEWDRVGLPSSGAGNGAAGVGGDADASWGDFVEAPPTPPRPSPSFTPTSSSSREAPPPPVPIVRNGHPKPLSSSSSQPHSHASRAATYPDPSHLSVRSSSTSTASNRPPRPSQSTRNRSTGGQVGGSTPSTGGAGAFDPAAGAIRLVGVRPGVVRVLDEDVAEGIRPSLPPRLRLSPKWTLLYSLDQHGISLSTLFSQLEKGLKERDGGFVLVIRTERGEILGGYVSEALKRPGSGREERGKERWVGDGTCFLFLTRPFPPSDPRLGLITKTFPPTFRNTFFAHASGSTPGTEAFLAFGGGNDGVFGLWIDGQMERGWTGRSETYGNEPLVTREGGGEDAEGGERGKFVIVGLECWAVGT